VLRHQASGEQRPVDVAPDASDTGFSATVDAGTLPAGAEKAVWELVAVPPAASGRGDVRGVESAIDTALVPPVMLPRDGDLIRVRLRSSAAGLVVEVDRMPPHAEVRRVVVEADALVLEAELHRVPPLPPAAGAVLVATSRERTVEVESPAVLEGGSLRARVPLDRLAQDTPGTEYWDLSVRGDAFGMLRIGGHLDDVVDKKNAIAFPHRDLPSPAGGRTLRPYFTVHNNLSIRSTPRQASAPRPPRRRPSGRRASIRRARPPSASRSTWCGRWRCGWRTPSSTDCRAGDRYRRCGRDVRGCRSSSSTATAWAARSARCSTRRRTSAGITTWRSSARSAVGGTRSSRCRPGSP
jgi:hypothetical protein